MLSSIPSISWGYRCLSAAGYLWGVVLLFSPTLAGAQGVRPISEQFQWKFHDDAIGSALPTCLPLGILVQSWNINLNDTFGIPPYYMIAWAIGGTPQTTFIGTDNKTLSYTVAHPPDTQLMLNVVDSTGSGGGIPPRLFKVVPGQTTQCVVPEVKKPDFTVSSNVTDTLSTCEPWGLSIKGGVPPYKISIAAVNFPLVTNVTIPGDLDAFTYVNRIAPNGQAIGTPLVRTIGDEDTECRGRASGAGSSAELGLNRSGGSRSSRSNASLIAGVTVPLVLLLLGGLAFIIWTMRKRRKVQESENGLPFTPADKPTELITPFEVGSPEGTFIRTLNSPPLSEKRLLAATTSDRAPITVQYPARSGSTSSSDTLLGNNVSSGPAFSPSHAGASVRSRPSFAAFPAYPTRRSMRKAQEAAQEAARRESVANSPDSEYPESLIPATFARQGEEIVIQHRDAGAAVVRELPPPYADQGSRG
ncbi:hypothetical protein CC1G_02694 [Coprinopsis cinerea okayama7|uniref:Uncharacterized protein n=1 Tax=Coprinopsis cinerea (strain Okayama-7 / 130 / ATCC MYA-4618 / FGSC 9003) TaxID=240176 RepID=A8PBP0_COPC7|nr:hypothetical protein CC1G_02694 [Coprinopsis cinerea okayama7\|eukprot:XP_001840231.2 hypothetical protein CC1G_02694 [Coprinopsis cinerea okayama7\